MLIRPLLNNIHKGRFIYRSFLVLPWVISPTVAGFAWKWLYGDKSGYINIFLTRLNIIDSNITWLGNTKTALFAVIVANVWRLFPFCMIMFLAGLQAVSKELEEAANIDGANAWQRFFYIIMPQMRRVITIVVLLSFIWNFNEFAIIYVMTKGGPLNSTTVLPVIIRNLSFLNQRIGTASALAIILVVFLMILSVIYLKVIWRKESD